MLNAARGASKRVRPKVIYSVEGALGGACA